MKSGAQSGEGRKAKVKAKSVVTRGLASRDVEDAIDYFGAENAEQAALDFIKALEHAFTHIGRNPATGSPRYAHELNVHALRFWTLAKFPFLVFYLERADHVDVWRILHAQRDIDAWMQSLRVTKRSSKVRSNQTLSEPNCGG